jgi:hypothetical protein
MFHTEAPNVLHTLLTIVTGGVWIFHGLFSKILNGVPRHRLIVCRILGERVGPAATKLIGLLESVLGLWIFSGYARVECAAVQSAAIVGMNVLEIWLARELLISAFGMLALNAGFLTLVWYWALSAPRA